MSDFTIVLVNPQNPRGHVYDFNPPFLEHIGLGYVAASLRQAGFPVKLINFETDAGRSDTFLEEMARDQPRLVGFTTSFETITPVLSLCQKMKTENPTLHLCLGGHHATFCAKAILKENPWIDSIVQGEGDLTTVELVSTLQNGRPLRNLKGICYREGETIVQNPPRENVSDLDQLPFPARDNLASYSVSYGVPSSGILVLSSRGCYGKCSFCSVASFYRLAGRSAWRPRSAENFVDEIEQLQSKFGAFSFSFSDDTFLCPTRESKQRAYRIASEIIRRDLTLLFSCCFRMDSFDPDNPDDVQLLRLLKKAGLFSIYLGLESGCPQELKIYQKGTSLNKVRHLLAVSRGLGVPVEAGFIMFNPYSTVSSITANAEFLRSLDMGMLFHHFSSRVQLQPGIALINRLKEEGRLKEPKGLSDVYYYTFQDPVVENVAGALDSLYDKVAVQDRIILTYYLSLFYLINKINGSKKTASNSSLKISAGKASGEFKDLMRKISQENLILFQETVRMAQEGWSSSKFAGLSEPFIRTNQELANDLGALYDRQSEMVREYGEEALN